MIELYVFLILFPVFDCKQLIVVIFLLRIFAFRNHPTGGAVAISVDCGKQFAWIVSMRG